MKHQISKIKSTKRKTKQLSQNEKFPNNRTEVEVEVEVEVEEEGRSS